MTRTLSFLAASAVLAIAAYALWPRGSDSAAVADTLPEGALVAVTLPDSLTDVESLGETAFEAKCAACHGLNAAGRDGAGPPLVHIIYEPSHHGDAAFHLAVERGVRSHHWPFGNMPAQDGLTRADVTAIVAYVRRLQRENGIE